ncbi:exo-beta-N-acetylmuramidase NamZ family protein [Candidatus Palauibacter sp.]|uniref:exo-beta-N-acetylmuramidase NamZ family protein n=1 Tax=Candidatus Palauibacter sp. TaxID=3101350 RepID=UPI003CC554FC
MRRHPAAHAILAAWVLVGCGGTPEVRPGVEVLLADSSHLIDGRRVGLITNRSGVGRDGTSSIDLLHQYEGAELVALFAPEHGIRGTEVGGAAIDDETDAATGLPVYSLYGETLAPTPEMLAGIDVLAFDLQDIGARYYTYVSTMARAMTAAGHARVPLIVLDRPNPIGGLVQGPVLDPAFASFVGLYPVPVRHGLTAGELARLYRGEFDVEVELHVVPADGWSADRWFDDTELPWIAPSPNMPSIESAAHYPGTCLFEGTNISVGRGTDAAFQLLGAPWLDGEAWAAGIREHAGAAGLPGVEISAATFTPESPGDRKFAGETVSGIRLTVTDRSVYDPVRTAVAALLVARRLSGSQWSWREAHFDRLAGSDRLRLAIERGATLDDIASAWAASVAAFETLARPYLIYPR